MADKPNNKGEEFKGRAKESLGAAADNDDLRREGKADQTSANVKDKIDKARDGLNNAIDKARGNDK